MPLSDTVLTKWTAASLSRDGYIQNLTTGEKDGGVDQTIFRGDMLWTASDTLSLRFNYLYNDNTFTEPKVVDAIFRTYGDPGIMDVIGLPEFYGTVPGVEPFSAANNQAGFPGGRVGQWENRSNMTLANEMEAEQVMVDINWDLGESMSVQFLTGYTDQVQQARERLGRQSVRHRLRLEPAGKRSLQPGDPVLGRARPRQLARRRLLLGAGDDSASDA